MFCGRGGLGWCGEVQGSKGWLVEGWEIPWFIYKVWGENSRQKFHISSQHMAAGITPNITIYGPFNIPLHLKPDQLSPLHKTHETRNIILLNMCTGLPPPPHSSHHHSTIPTLIACWPRYIHFLHMDIDNYVIGNSPHPLLPCMGSGNSPHPLLNMGPWVTHHLPTFESFYLSQPHTTSPTHIGSEISFQPHSHMNGFWNLPHQMHIFLESPILKSQQKKISLNIMPRQTYILT